MKRILIILLILLAIPVAMLQAQVKGKVVDDEGISLIGATILETGTSNGTVTDIEGNFSLAVSENASSIQVMLHWV